MFEYGCSIEISTARANKIEISIARADKIEISIVGPDKLIVKHRILACASQAAMSISLELYHVYIDLSIERQKLSVLVLIPVINTNVKRLGPRNCF